MQLSSVFKRTINSANFSLLVVGLADTMPVVAASYDTAPLNIPLNTTMHEIKGDAPIAANGSFCSLPGGYLYQLTLKSAVTGCSRITYGIYPYGASSEREVIEDSIVVSGTDSAYLGAPTSVSYIDLRGVPSTTYLKYQIGIRFSDSSGFLYNCDTTAGQRTGVVWSILQISN